MNLTKPVISAVKSVMIRVSDLPAARAFYEGTLGLQRIAEADGVTDKARRLWGLGSRAVRCLRLAKPGEGFGMIDLVEWAGGTAETIRDENRPWDYGWFTVNYRTNDMQRALAAVTKAGARIVSEPRSYEAGGKAVTEAMINLASGERCTLLQVGEADTLAPVFGEAAATIGAITPALDKSLAFYRDALGLNVVLSINRTGEPFSLVLGVPRASRLDMAMLTSGGNWVGKLQCLQLTMPPGSPTPIDTGARADGTRLGYWMMSVTCQDLDALVAVCRKAGVAVVRGPATIDRPCYGRVRAMIIRAPGGELWECLAPAAGK